MGTGCGNIAISLARNTQNTQILASDISASAIDIARKNGVRLLGPNSIGIIDTHSPIDTFEQV